MFLLAGLGNPGESYARTRHNIGFLAADEIARAHGFGPWKSRFHGLIAEGRLPGIEDKVLLLKPETFMNDSGRAIQAAMQFYKILPGQVFVLYDDLDLPVGRVRVKRGGSPAGHNGIRSIDQMVGQEYWRIRFGIGHPGDKTQVLGYVLGAFSGEDKAWLGEILAALPKHLALLLAGKDALFMTRMAEAVSVKQAKDTQQDVEKGQTNGL